MRAVKTMYSLFCFRCIWFSVCDPNVICMVQLSSDLRKQYLYRTTAVLCAQCLDLSNLDNPRGTDSHIIGHAFSEPAGLITCRGVGGCMQNRLIPSPLSDCGRAGKSRRVWAIRWLARRCSACSCTRPDPSGTAGDGDIARHMARPRGGYHRPGSRSVHVLERESLKEISSLWATRLHFGKLYARIRLDAVTRRSCRNSLLHGYRGSYQLGFKLRLG